MLMEFGPVGNDGREGWAGVLILALFFGTFLFGWSVFEETRRRRKLKTVPPTSSADES